MTDDDLLAVLVDTAGAIAAELADTIDWSLADTRPGQYLSDLAADRVAVAAITGAGLGVFSEESGGHHLDRATVVVVDPLDGSTNASRHLSWFATSLCAVDHAGLAAAVVLDLVHSTRYEAVRNGGARRNGEPIRPTAVTDLADALVGLNGLPSAHLGWGQFRALGAAALDLCAVADGRLDGFVDCTDDGLAPWDYLGGLLICREAGAAVADLHGRDLEAVDAGRRTVVAGATASLVDTLASARRSAGPAVAPPRLDP